MGARTAQTIRAVGQTETSSITYLWQKPHLAITLIESIRFIMWTEIGQTTRMAIW